MVSHKKNFVHLDSVQFSSTLLIPHGAADTGLKSLKTKIQNAMGAIIMLQKLNV